MEIKELRKAARVSQVEIAVKAGIHRARLSAAECGYIQLTPSEEHKIRHAITEAANRQVESVRNALAVCEGRELTLATA